MKFNLRKYTYFDFVLFFSVIALTTIGISFIYSSGINSEGINVSNEYIKQIVWASVGILIMLSMVFIDYRRYSDRTMIAFVIAMCLLVYTRLFGRYVNGAKSWIGIGELGIQPSEFTKILFILYLAHYLDRSSRTENPFRRFIQACLIMAVPVVLILSQPDLGTATVYIPVFLAMCYFAGIPLRYLGIVFFTGVLSILFTVLPIWEDYIIRREIPLLRILSETKFLLITLFFSGLVTTLALVGHLVFKTRYYYWIAYFGGIVTVSLLAALGGSRVLKQYQVMRLIVFLDPSVDPLGSGWNIIQSVTAVGSGGPVGMGFLQGTQSHYRFLPQQSTDFIFSILSEEWGFLGGLTVFTLYLIILLRGLYIAKKTGNSFGSLLAVGIVAMFFYHFMVNVGMVMGVMPITGIPLLFLSYGGSSLWTAMFAVGLLISINLRRLEN